MKQTRNHRLWTAALTLCLVLGSAGCSKGHTSQDTVYEDMKASFEESGLMSANIGLISKTEKGDSISYGEFGSGVIFEKEDNTYYALTAAHVVSVENAQLLVFTVNTDMATEEIAGIEDMNILKPEVYDSMYKAETLFVSSKDDVAVIRFSCDEDLSAVKLADNDPMKDDRIMCIGNPQNDWFAVSFGQVVSGIEKFGESTGFPSNGMKHTAYMNVGSSGGAAMNEAMQLAGTTPGVYMTADQKNVDYGILIPVSEIRACLEEWSES